MIFSDVEAGLYLWKENVFIKWLKKINVTIEFNLSGKEPLMLDHLILESNLDIFKSVRIACNTWKGGGGCSAKGKYRKKSKRNIVRWLRMEGGVGGAGDWLGCRTLIRLRLTLKCPLLFHDQHRTLYIVQHPALCGRHMCKSGSITSYREKRWHVKIKRCKPHLTWRLRQENLRQRCSLVHWCQLQGPQTK